MEISFKQTLFSIDPKNKRCNDCGEKNVAYVSVNNGITICELCAQIHRQLGPQISELRKIDEEFDDYSMNFFIYGGNKNFRKTLKSLGVNLDMQRSKLYKTYGVEYYRKCLKSKVKGEENNEKQPLNPNEILFKENNDEKNFSEDKNSVNNINNFLNINNNEGNKTNVNDEEDNGESHIQLNYQNNLNNINSHNKKENTDKKGILKLSINKMKIFGGYIKKNSVKSIEKIKKAGNIIAQKSKPATDKIKSTAKYMGEHIPYFHKNKVKSQEDINTGNFNIDNNHNSNNQNNNIKDDKKGEEKNEEGKQIEF